jgi:broad specificity phosphatase PhoE
MTNKPTIIYLVRHGESEANVAGLISGQIDPPLTERGHSQAHDAKHKLENVNFDVAYSSDLQRAVRTAETVYGKPIHKSKQLSTLRERSFGSLEGKLEKHIGNYYEVKLNLPKDESLAYKHVVDMESDQDVGERMFNELSKIAKKHSGQTVLIGNHGTAMRIVLQTVLNKHPKEVWPQKFINGGYIKLSYAENRFVIEEVYGYN